MILDLSRHRAGCCKSEKPALAVFQHCGLPTGVGMGTGQNVLNSSLNNSSNDNSAVKSANLPLQSRHRVNARPTAAFALKMFFTFMWSAAPPYLRCP